MTSNAKLTSFLIFFLLFSTAFAVSNDKPTALAVSNDKPTAYEVVQSYNLPPGILPKGVVDYELNKETGEFTVYFNSTCKFTIESYQLQYKSSISGVITSGHVKKLKGVKVKILFFWLNIVEVSVDGGDIDFSVGIASASFAADNFVESPQCGCGFDCNGLKFSY